MLDIGCGGGLISEPLARLGAEVVGADASATNIEVARLHAAESGVAVDYRAETAEALQEAGERFDVVLALEVVEHVSDVNYFLTSAARMVKPGGLIFVATINRTMKALTFAIVGAEYVLGWLPRARTNTPSGAPRRDRRAARRGRLHADRPDRVVYHPLADAWRRSRDMDVKLHWSSNRRYLKRASPLFPVARRSGRECFR